MSWGAETNEERHPPGIVSIRDVGRGRTLFVSAQSVPDGEYSSLLLLTRFGTHVVVELPLGGELCSPESSARPNCRRLWGRCLAVRDR
jgi:hypothetical protein